ncbi:hypothetical protein BY996DRAFT_7736138 [Phakopsora pachyrhizi]|nr:hypothetical protein BY996DRAFT_7736138 [Phakopsora pachyrhizi]
MDYASGSNHSTGFHQKRGKNSKARSSDDRRGGKDGEPRRYLRKNRIQKFRVNESNAQNDNDDDDDDDDEGGGGGNDDDDDDDLRWHVKNEESDALLSQRLTSQGSYRSRSSSTSTKKNSDQSSKTTNTARDQTSLIDRLRHFGSATRTDKGRTISFNPSGQPC